jgi:hypothetical protein
MAENAKPAMLEIVAQTKTMLETGSAGPPMVKPP